MNFHEQDYAREAMRDFVVGVESQFYPRAGRLYELRIEAWGAARRAELAGKCAGYRRQSARPRLLPEC
jgi:hypothetical protein